MNIGLFFGSFNPVHIGHLIIAEYMSCYMDEIWLVVSPQSPFKEKDDLLSVEHRVKMLELAIVDNPRIKISKVELDLPTPSYTVDTLRYLKKKHKTYKFDLIMGSDNILGLQRWRSHEYILSHDIWVYPRKGYEYDNELKTKLGDKVHHTEAPMLDISSTYIRTSISDGIAVSYMLRERVWEYIEQKKLYH